MGDAAAHRLIASEQAYLIRERAECLAAAREYGAAHAAAGLLLEGGGRLPGSQCDVLVCARGGDGLLQVGDRGCLSFQKPAWCSPVLGSV